jgi:hypothetical protein
MVNPLTTSIITDSPLIIAPSLHAIAEVHVANRQRKKRNRYRNP